MATEQSIMLVLEEDPSLRQTIRTCLQGSGFAVEGSVARHENGSEQDIAGGQLC